MEQSFWIPFVASLAAATVTASGVCVIRFREHWALDNAMYFAAFAAGVLISVSFLHIVPKSIELSSLAPVFLLAGYFSMHLLNRFVNAYVCDGAARADYAIGVVPLVGIGLHSLIDGVIYAVTFKINVVTGALAAIGMILHEFPEGVFTYILLRKGGIGPRNALYLAIAGAGLTTPLGVILSYPALSWIGPGTLALSLAVSAGALIYVGATHLLPSAEREPGRFSLLALLAGMLVAIGIVASHN